MKEELLQMTQREVQRYHVLGQVLEEEFSLGEATATEGRGTTVSRCKLAHRDLFAGRRVLGESADQFPEGLEGVVVAQAKEGTADAG
jgi:hypothetical protein